MNMNACLDHCRVCTNRQMNAQTGMVCGLTSAKPSFVDMCPDFKADAQQVTYYQKREQQLAAENDTDAGGSFFAPEQKGVKKGVMGGVVMIVIALVWFFGGLAAGYIFWYPPVLLLFGLYAVIKGIATNNYTGQGG